jgi:hypothetical protein
MTLRTLYKALKRDNWRKDHPFPEDIQIANEVLFDTFAEAGQRKEVIVNWFQRFQPCLFGRIAAATRSLHVCVLTEEDFLSRNDKEIGDIIKRELLEWKRRSAKPTKGFSSPAHGFALVAASSRLAYAAPDEHLSEFAHKLLDIWGCEATNEASGTVHWENLYLQHPQNRSYQQFTFSVDYFGAQGDGRWWHDHRCPGGILFTANSVGHMQKYREWYQSLKDQQDWVLQTAMLTIQEAAQTHYGKATWLKDLEDGRPVLEEIACPFSRPDAVKDAIADKDWTRYGGYLHTDHSIRPEFFHDNPEPNLDISDREYLQDFTYLYDPTTPDYERFVAGTNISEEEIRNVLGPMSGWNQVAIRRRKPLGNTVASSTRPIKVSSGTPPTGKSAQTEEEESRARIRKLIQRSRVWRLSAEEKKALGL